MEPNRQLRISRWGYAALSLALLGGLTLAACTLLLDRDDTQCETDADCASFGGHPYCRQKVCVASNLGPDGCFFGTPQEQSDFANQCTVAQCEVFDNCGRLGLCDPGAQPPPAIAPPPIDAGIPVDASTVDAMPPAMPPCVAPATRNTIVVGGSTALQPFLSIVAPLVAAGSPSYQIAYQPSGSCTGVDQLFHPDPNKHIVKDIPGRQALLFNTDGTSAPCTFGPVGTMLDVAVSDVFANACTSTYAPSTTLAEYLGPIQPMTFVVPATSSESVISAEMGHVVFGRGNTDDSAVPWTDPALFFVRSKSSGTQQMLARAIDVDAAKWWGIDRGGSTRVRDLLEAVDPSRASKAIGILSTDFADSERNKLNILAFQGKEQLCGFYPDATRFTRDKINVRDGHYPIWGPVHLFARVTDGVPNAAAAALVTRFTLPRLDDALLDAIIESGLIPPCAMQVSRTAEMGPLSSYSPPYHCGCYYAATVPGGVAPVSCKSCSGPADCPSTAPACNKGYCELR